MEIYFNTPCNPSVRFEIIKRCIICYASGDLYAMNEFFHKDFELNLIGEHYLKGKLEAMAFLKDEAEKKPTKVEIENIITHGKLASAMGLLVFQTKKEAFNINLEFSSAGSTLIRKIHIFKIPVG